MAFLAAMIELGAFKKIGTRLPKSLRDWLKVQVSECEDRVSYIDGDDITQEGVVGCAILYLRELPPEERLAVIARLAPRLMDLFEAEGPGGQKEGIPAEGDAGGGTSVVFEPPRPVPRSATPKPRKRLS